MMKVLFQPPLRKLIVLFLLFLSGELSAQLLYTQSPEKVSELLRKKNSLIKSGDKIVGSYKKLTVADKKRFEVTKDKNNYVSMASYWWPDPKKKDGLPYVRKDGKYNPEIKTRYTDYSEMVELSQRIRALGEAYYVSKDLKYVREAEKYLKVWFISEQTKMNPNLNHGQMIMGRDKGRVEGIIDTRILIDLIEGIDFLNYARAVDPSVHEGVKVWFREFLNWMETSPLGKKGFTLKNNIATSYHLQRMVYYTFLGEDRKAYEVYHNDINKLFNNQIDDDGRQALELSRTDPMGYSKANLNYLKQCINLIQNLKGEDGNMLNGNKQRMQRAQEYINKNR